MIKILSPIILVLLLLSGCGDNSGSVSKEPQASSAYVIFDSQNSDIPYPNNILFAGSTDRTLNIAYKDTDSDAVVKKALDTLDGFSTTSPISVSFSGEINASTLINGVKVYEIASEANASTGGVPIIKGITKDLTFGVDYVTTISGNKIIILPIKPLKGNQSYMIVLTKDIKDNAGNPIAPDVASELFLQTTPLVDKNGNHTTLSIDDATSLEGIRQATQAMIGYTVAQKGIARENIVTAWSFKTQSIGKFYKNVEDANKSGLLKLVNSGLTTANVGGFAKADIWVGTLSNLPYYLGSPSPTNPTAPLIDYFVDANKSAIFSGMPQLQSRKTIPVLMTKPNSSSLAVQAGAKAPWPIVIFQHGITQNRTNLLAIADALADVGYASIAIDLPLHGLDNNSTGLMTNYERTFNLDLVNNSTGAVGADGIIDSSGTHYINLASLLTSRDNLRQSASDLLALKNAISGLSDINANRIAFVGHSLGTIASFGFLSQNRMESVTLAMPGGGIAQLLNNSAEFGPIISAGLASKGVIKGTNAYSAFMLATQTVMDDADPINYASVVGAKQKILAMEVVGNGTEGTSDRVIPNSVATAPLSGTEPLLRYMGTTNLTTSSAPNKAARFTVGTHSSILDPSSSLPATTEMQKEMASFVYSKGTFIKVTDPSVLKTN